MSPAVARLNHWVERMDREFPQCDDWSLSALRAKVERDWPAGPVKDEFMKASAAFVPAVIDRRYSGGDDGASLHASGEFYRRMLWRKD